VPCAGDFIDNLTVPGFGGAGHRPGIVPNFDPDVAVL
jgi:hypothetical protein